MWRPAIKRLRLKTARPNCFVGSVSPLEPRVQRLDASRVGTQRRRGSFTIRGGLPRRHRFIKSESLRLRSLGNKRFAAAMRHLNTPPALPLDLVTSQFVLRSYLIASQGGPLGLYKFYTPPLLPRPYSRLWGESATGERRPGMAGVPDSGAAAAKAILFKNPRGTLLFNSSL